MSEAPETNKRFILSKRMALYLLIGLVLIWIAILYRSVLSSLIVGALLAYLLTPLAKFLAKKLPISYKISSWVTFITFLILLITLTRYSAPIVVRQIDTLTNDFQLISKELINLQPFLDNILNIDVPMDEIISELEGEINQILVPNRLFLIIRSATANSVWIMITLITCFYLLLDHEKFISWIYLIAPNSVKETIKGMLLEIDQVWKSYLRGQLLMMLIIGIASGLGGIVVGLRNALIIGILAGFLEMIPSFGPTVSTLIAGMTAWTQGSANLDISNFWFAILVCVLFIAIQAVENIILIPRIMGRRMGLHPALVFIAIISTLALFGVIAGLIVIPVISSLGVIINHSFRQLNQTNDGFPLTSASSSSEKTIP
jgi:predicted PurR-regulated permease PerM